MKFKVGVVSADWARDYFDQRGHPVPGGANYVRLQQWQPLVNFDVVDGVLVHSPLKGFGVVDGNKKVHHDLDVIVMQRLMFKDLKYLLRKKKRKGAGPIIVNDLDDWYWGLDPSNAAYALCQPERNSEENIEHYKEIMKLSDVVTVSTPFLADKMSNWLKHPNVVLVENCVTTEMFAQRPYRNKRPVVGWCGSTSHRSRDLEELQGIFPPSFRWHHTGYSPSAPQFSEALGIPVHRLTTLPPLPPEEYAKRGFCFDIGIAPLSDKPFNAAKSWIKAIEYAAAGVPFVASKRAEYVRLQEEYGIGRIANTPEEWLENIGELGDPRQRLLEAKRNRRIVEEFLDVKRMASEWDRLIASIAS